MFFKNRYLKRSRAFSRPKRIMHGMFVTILGVFGVLIGITGMISINKYNDDDDYSSLIYGRDETKHVEVVTKPINPTNPDGTINGLNLLLIGKLNDCYLKDYLQTCQDEQEGKFNDFPRHVTIGMILGTIMTEEGTYGGEGILPVSMLPYNSSTHQVIWKQDYQGIPAEAMTLQQANKNVFSSRYGYGNGPVTPYSGADTMAGGTYGPFQITPNEVDSSQKAKIDGYQSNSSRGFDMVYMPDQLSHFDARMKILGDSYVNLEGLSDEALFIAWGLQYNPGVGAMKNGDLIGTQYKSAEMNNSLEDLAKDMKTIYDKYGTVIGKIMDIPNKRYAAVCFALMHDCGWNAMTYNINNLTQYSSAFTLLFPGEDFNSFMNSHTEQGGRNYYGVNRSFAWLHKPGPIEHYSDLITLGHMLSYSYLGDYYYGMFLQLAGVEGVDADNPATYFNTIKEEGVGGEWTPSGDISWMEDLGIDVTKLGPNRVNLLNTAHTQLGVPYVWGGTSWGSGMDCSGFVQQAIKQTFGVTVGRTTYDQAVDSNFTVVPSIQEALPGDIMIISDVWAGRQHHVVFFLKDNGDGTCTVMHEPRTGDVCKIGPYATNNRTAIEIRRFNQLEGPNP